MSTLAARTKHLGEGGRSAMWICVWLLLPLPELDEEPADELEAEDADADAAAPAAPLVVTDALLAAVLDTATAAPDEA